MDTNNLVAVFSRFFYLSGSCIKMMLSGAKIQMNIFDSGSFGIGNPFSNKNNAANHSVICDRCNDHKATRLFRH